MRFSILSVAAIFLLFTTMTVVSAQTQATCTTRMGSVERAKCMVEWHRQVMQQLGRASSSYSQTATSSVTSVSAGSASVSPSGSSAAPMSCSRAFGAVRAACLVQQRKEILRKLSGQPPQARASSAHAKNAVRRACTRYSDVNLRKRCLAGEDVTKPLSPSSSSTMSSSWISSMSSSSTFSSSSSSGTASSGAISSSSGMTSSGGSSSSTGASSSGTVGF